METIRMNKITDNHYEKMIIVNGLLGHMQIKTNRGKDAAQVLYMFYILRDNASACAGCAARCYGNRSKLVLKKDKDSGMLKFFHVDKLHMETMLNTARATMEIREFSREDFYNRSVVFFGKEGEIREPQNLKFG